MEPTTILIIVNLVLTVVMAPLVAGLVEIAKKIKHSKCWGIDIEMTEQLKKTQSEANLKKDEDKK